VVVRDLGPAAMGILKARDDVEVRSLRMQPEQGLTILQVVMWPEDRVAPREWTLENCRGAHGAIIMPTDKARLHPVSICLTS
jgi:hypothetical protein